jgi:hypothetical protein
VQLYPRFSPTPLTDVVFNGLFNPVAVAYGAGRIHVLDQGDTALARDPVTRKVTNLELYWRVRIFGLLGGDTLSSPTGFTDTTMAFVQGVAADNQGSVYVSGTAIILVPSQDNPSVFTREFQSRIYRYLPGPLPGGGADPRMPGSNWHRDDSYAVLNGTGTESVSDPRGLFWWNPGGLPSLYAADYGNSAAKKLGSLPPLVGYLSVDGAPGEVPINFLGVEDVAVDAPGFIYLTDVGNRRVLRFDDTGAYVQRVDLELGNVSPSQHHPYVVAADDSLAYVGSRDVADPTSLSGKVMVYRRRQ